MIKILNQAEKANYRFHLFKSKDRILIALSGGPDSVALFHILSILAPKYKLSIAAAHVNHMLREDADMDWRFCRELCRAYGYKFHSRKVDIRKRAKKLKIGVEQAGRDFRYSFFRSLCDKHGYSKIATGHTADDSAETFLFNLIRGADLGGLGGIPPKRDNIIRPLIEVSKNDVFDFLKEHKLSFRIDKSNVGLEYNRNIIRNKIIPRLNKINPQASSHIGKAAAGILWFYELLQKEVESAYRNCLIDESKRQIILDLGKLPVYYESLESWVLLRAYFQLTGTHTRLSSSKVERVLSLSRRGSVVFLDNGIIVTFHDGRLILNRPSRAIKRIKLRRNFFNKLEGTGLEIRIDVVKNFELDKIANNDNESIAYLDDDKARVLSVRNIEEGDKFKPLGLEGTKKLVDYLNDKGVPHIMKKSIPLIISDNRIAWIAGYGISDDFKVDGETKKVLRLQLVSK